MSYGFTPETDAERSTANVQPDAWFPAVTADECASLLSIDDTVSNAILNNCLALAVDDVIFNLQTWAENQQADGAEFADDPRRVTRYKNAVYNATKALILRDAQRTDRTADAEAISDDNISALEAAATKYTNMVSGRRRIGVHSV